MFFLALTGMAVFSSFVLLIMSHLVFFVLQCILRGSFMCVWLQAIRNSKIV